MANYEAQTAEAIELTLVPGIGSSIQRRLLETCPELSEIYTLGANTLANLGAPPESAEAIAARHYRSMSEEILDWCGRERCRLLLRGRQEYPSILNEIYDPPLILYARGDPSALEAAAVAIVGTRKPTPYGLQMAEGLACDLASRGVVVISGLARGIDAAAHRGCLDANGRTIAVLGCGIDVTYPREHRRLTERILERGLTLSEFPPGTSPAPQNFPVRNRIISGLSLGTLIVEASEYSGSLITARLAMEQNREVLAIPGNLTSPRSFGPNFLIKQGAKLVQSWRDIVEEFPPEMRQAILANENRQADTVPPLALLTDEEKRILDLLDTDKATQFDRILARSECEISRLSDLMFNLEMRGWIRQVPGNLFVRVTRPPK